MTNPSQSTQNNGIAIDELCRVRVMHGLVMADVSDEIDERRHETVRENLRRARKLRGYTQKSLSKAAGIKLGTYGPMESGHDKPTLRVVAAVAEALGVTVDELLGTEPADSAAAIHAEIGQGGQVSNPLATRLTATVDLPKLDVEAGDVLTIASPRPLWPGALVLVEQDGGPTLYRVAMVEPFPVLERDGAPSVILDDDHHRVIGVAVSKWRDLTPS